MNLGTARTAVAVASTAGLLLSGAASASADGRDDHKRPQHGWVKVCQDIKEHGRDHGRDDHDHDKDNRKYHGVYKVEDSSYRTQYIHLWGKYDCDEVKVRKGKVHVEVVYEPDHTRLRGDDERWIWVDRGEYKRVTFYYDAKKKDKDDDGHYSRAA